MELPSRFELLSQNYKFRVLPLNYGSIMAGDAGFKPAMQESKSCAFICLANPLKYGRNSKT